MARRKSTNNKTKGSSYSKSASMSVLGTGNANNPLLDSTCNIPFSCRLGDPLDLGDNGAQKRLYSHSLPGFMSFEVIPTVGIAKDSTSPINKAALDEYAFVVHKNSRNTSYEPADLMQYYISVASLYNYYAWARRVYMYARSFSATNAYLPNEQMKHLGANIPNIVNGSQLAAFRAFLNTFALNISRYRVPAKFNLLNTWYKLNQFVYLDDMDSSKAQRYIFNVGMYKYEPYTDKKGGKLTYVRPYCYENQATSLGDIVSTAESLLNSVELNEDIGTMMGDVEKAYGTENCFTVPLITEADVAADPIYDHLLLHAIDNLRCGWIDPVNISITQENGVIKFQPNVDVYLGWLNQESRRFLLTADKALNPDEVASVTSFMYTTNATGTITSCGNGIIAKYYVQTDKDSVTAVITEAAKSNDMAGLNDFIKLNAAMTKFAHYPRYYNALANTSGADISIQSWFGDVNYYTTISQDVLANIHLGRNMADVGFGTQIYVR